MTVVYLCSRRSKNVNLTCTRRSYVLSSVNQKKDAFEILRSVQNARRMEISSALVLLSSN
jgi:hypothetical protein